MHLLRLRRNNKHHQPHEDDRDPRTPHSSSSRVSSNEFDVRDAPSSNSSRNSGGAPSARFELKSNIRLRLYSSGTSLVTNDNDPIGDGDQSRVTDDEAQQVHQDLFRTGGDFYLQLPTSTRSNNSELSEFATHCVLGHHRKVKLILEENSMKHGKSLDTLVALLETRETSMRLTPLLMVVAVLRTFGIAPEASGRSSDDASPMATKPTNSGGKISPNKPPLAKKLKQREIAILEKNLLQVVMILLEYGARPDARDVCGKTVCHYGAGIDATETSMAAVTMCIGACTSAHFFGKEIVLRNMHDEVYDGQGGIAAGYQAETGRRLVYMFGQKEDFSVLNRNLQLVNYNQKREKVLLPPKPTAKLVNIQDRSGRTALFDLLQSNRVDVAKFLLHKHEASLDAPNWDGYTLRGLVSMQAAISDVQALLAAAVIKDIRNAQKKAENECVNCGTTGTHIFQACRACKSVRFCSDKCRKENWQTTHYKECHTLRKLYKQFALVSLPTFSNEVPMTCFRRPVDINTDEKFTVKLQRMVGDEMLLVTDHTGYCEFVVGRDQKYYKKLLAKVQSEDVTGGTKTFMEASFDKKGQCRLYLNHSKLRTW